MTHQEAFEYGKQATAEKLEQYIFDALKGREGGEGGSTTKAIIVIVGALVAMKEREENLMLEVRQAVGSGYFVSKEFERRYIELIAQERKNSPVEVKTRISRIPT